MLKDKMQQIKFKGEPPEEDVYWKTIIRTADTDCVAYADLSGHWSQLTKKTLFTVL